MKIGLFDHVEQIGGTLADELDARLEFVCAADEAGFYCYHVAEHHCTPLNMVPSPGVYLGAVARATKRIRLGPLVYLLPLYAPLRVIEEICLLDHLSRGRLEVGVGRGVSPFELRYQHVDQAESREIFLDAFNCIVAGLTHEELTYGGPHFSYEKAPLPLRPFRKPYPPFWYGSSQSEGSHWAGRRGLHFVTNGPNERAGANIQAYRSGLAERGAPDLANDDFRGGAAVGVTRHIVVAENDADAERVARPAFEYHLAHLNWLRNKHGSTEFTSRLHVHQNMSYDQGVRNGMVIAGPPRTVLTQLRAQVKELGINYLIAYLNFGSLAFSDAMRSLRLFAAEVMPELEALA